MYNYYVPVLVNLITFHFTPNVHAFVNAARLNSDSTVCMQLCSRGETIFLVLHFVIYILVIDVYIMLYYIIMCNVLHVFCLIDLIYEILSLVHDSLLVCTFNISSSILQPNNAVPKEEPHVVHWREQITQVASITSCSI